MRKIYLALVLAAAAAPALAADVGVSVSVNQPGVYGRIDIGHAPVPPVVVYRQPMIIAPAPVAVQAPPPIYLHVPPGHSRNWRKYCGRYNACGQPVYFVREDWYQRHYHRGDDHHGNGHHGHGRHHGHQDHRHEGGRGR
jgi:hypothetical protein